MYVCMYVYTCTDYYIKRSIETVSKKRSHDLTHENIISTSPERAMKLHVCWKFDYASTPFT